MSEWYDAECERCDEYTECIRTPDPFVSQVYPEDGPYSDETLCRDCIADRADEV